MKLSKLFLMLWNAFAFPMYLAVANAHLSSANVVNKYLNRVALIRAVPNLIHTLFAVEESLGNAVGKYMEFFRTNKITVDVTPLTEGVTKDAIAYTQTKISLTIEQHGNYILTSDLTQATETDVALNDAVDTLGENAGETLDTVAREAFVGGTTVCRANGVASRVAIITACAKADLDRLQNTLKSANAGMITRLVPTDTRTDIQNVAAAYPVIVHTDLEDDIETAAGTKWTPVEKYPTGAVIFPGEFGKYRSLRFMSTTNAKVHADLGGAVAGTGLRSTTGTSCDVYTMLAFANRGCARVALAGESLRIIRKSAKEGGTSDPLEQRNTTGWKASQVFGILDHNFIARLELAATE